MSVRNILRITPQGFVVDQQISLERQRQYATAPPVEDYELSSNFAETLAKKHANTHIVGSPGAKEAATSKSTEITTGMLPPSDVPTLDDSVTGMLPPSDVPTRYMDSSGSTVNIFAPIIVLCPQDLLKVMEAQKTLASESKEPKS